MDTIHRQFKVIDCTDKNIVGSSCSGVSPLEACKKLANRKLDSLSKQSKTNITLKETGTKTKKKTYRYVVKNNKGNLTVSSDKCRSIYIGGADEPPQQLTTNIPSTNATIQEKGTQLVTLAKTLQSVNLEDILRNPERKPETNIPSGGRPADKSSFVIITYWWGRGNDNKNLQYPCPEDIGKEETIDNYKEKPRFKPREKFENMIDTWKKNVESMGCYYYVQEFPEFAKPGMYQLAINVKPMFIRQALDYCSKNGFKGVVYIDGDMSVNTYPAIFDLDDVDFMARGWNIDPRSAAAFRENKVCFDPFVFETSGGIMYFGNTVYSRQLLDIWTVASAKKINQGKADDRIISLMFNALGLFIPYNIIQLPIEYLWLTDIYGEKRVPLGTSPEHVKKGHVVYNYTKDELGKRVFSSEPSNASGDIIFEHPACLTGEERAADQGASSNRTPPFYESLVEDKIECSRHAGVFYEFVYFYNGKDKTKAAAVESYQKYLSYSQSVELPEPNPDNLPPFYVVPYKEAYGEHKNVVANNLKQLNKPLDVILDNALLPNPKRQESRRVNVFVTVQGTSRENENIKLILSNLVNGYDVLYLPPAFMGAWQKQLPMFGGSGNHAEIIAYMKKNIPVECEFVSFVADTDDYQPDFLTNMPMYFSHRSRTLRHLLLMSKTITPSIDDIKDSRGNTKIISTGLNDVFRSSFIFLTRIRCKWLDAEDVFSKQK